MTHDTPPPEWKNMTDWSDLPHVYVTKAESQQGMFWRIEACSVPMAIGPEVRLITASEADAMVAAALREAARTGDRFIIPSLTPIMQISETQLGRDAAAQEMQQRILALIPAPASAAIDKLIAEAVKAERERVTRIAASLFPGGYDNNINKIEDRVSEIAAKGATT